MRVLVVEDEQKIAYAIKKGLEQETYSVDLAFTGVEGYDLSSTEEYDVIILDLMLPEMSGMEVCSKLRLNKIQTPILMLTAKAELEDKVQGLNCGADDYLVKPFAFEELLARIRALLRRPAASLEAELICGDLSLNPQTYLAKRNNVEINLSKREFSLLEYLMRNSGKTLSKNQIIAHVWNYDDDVLPNTVEQYVGYLRNKVDKPFPRKPTLIHTVRGWGSKLISEEGK